MYVVQLVKRSMGQDGKVFEINDKEWRPEQISAEILKKLEDEKIKYTLQRSKGLGENEPDMMWKTTMNPASRRLIRVCEADAAQTAELLDILLGDNLAERKKFIAENGSKYVKDADIS